MFLSIWNRTTLVSLRYREQSQRYKMIGSRSQRSHLLYAGADNKQEAYLKSRCAWCVSDTIKRNECDRPVLHP